MAERIWTDGQLKAINGAKSQLVSASAGSGKTTVMIEKIIKFLESGGDITRVLVLTFSRASAAEMKEKLLVGLYSRIRQGGDPDGRLKKQIRNIPFSYISTIDSFCAEIVRRYFEDIGADPALTVLEESEAAALYDAAADEVFGEYLEGGDKGFLKLAEFFSENRRLDRLKSEIKRIIGFISVLKDPDEFLRFVYDSGGADINESRAVKFLLSEIRKTAAYMESAAEGLLARIKTVAAVGYTMPDAYTDNLIKYNNAFGAFSCAANLFDAVKASLYFSEGYPKPPADRKPYNDLRDDLRLESKAYFAKAKDAFSDISAFFGDGAPGSYDKIIVKELETRAVNAEFISVMSAVKARYDEFKRKEKKADFSDIERYAFDILKNPMRAAETAGGFDRIFMDEYQDTNYLQEAIVAAVSSGNAFMVGDVKQAIYKFRFAEPKLFLDRRRRYDETGEGENVDLNDNFRSRREILYFINLVFDRVMTYDFGGVEYRRDARLISGREIPGDPRLNPVTVKFFDREKKETEYPGVYTVKSAPKDAGKVSIEDRYVVKKIKELVGKAEIYDDGIGKMRKVRYGDIAVLMRFRRADGLLMALKDQKVPFNAPGFKEKSGGDIDTLINYLRIIGNMRDDVALYSVMRSFVGGFSENELAAIRVEGGGGFFYEAVKQCGKKGIMPKLNAFLNKLGEYNRISRLITADKLLDAILAESGFDAYLISRGGGRIERVNAFIGSIRGKEYSIRAEKLIAAYDASGGAETEVGGGAEDAVTVSTVHSAKGLEYPVVFLVSAEQGVNKARSTAELVRADSLLGISVKHRDNETRAETHTLSTKAHEIKALRDEAEENLRLCYVAMTRAKSLLFITGTGVSDIRSEASECLSAGEWINVAAKADARLLRYFDYDEPDLNDDACLQEDEENSIVRASGKIELMQSDLAVTGAGVSPKYTVSAIAEQDYEPDGGTYIPSLGSAGAEIGTLYHRVLEKIEFSADEDRVREVIRELAAERAADIKTEPVMNVLNSEFGIKARDGRVFRETPFMLYVPASKLIENSTEDKILVQGVIDLVVSSKYGENFVIDYKLSRLSPEEIKKKYRKQLEIYALAAERLLGINNPRKIIFVINQNLPIEI